MHSMNISFVVVRATYVMCNLSILSIKTVDAAHYPFNVAWRPVEIVSIYQVHKTKQSCLKLFHKGDNTDDTVESNDEEKDIRLEVRFLRKYDSTMFSESPCYD